MRIGIMCLSGMGGSARIATQLAAHLARRGHRVHLFARTTPVGAEIHTQGVTLHTVIPDLEPHIHPASLYLDWQSADLDVFLSHIMRVVATEGLDVLHFHYAVPFASLAAQVRCRLKRAAPLLVGTLHGTDVSTVGRDPACGPGLARTLARLDALTTVSVSHAALATRLFGLSTPPLVIPNFVDLATFKPARHRPRVGESPLDRPRIAHVSNFRAVKDPQSMARIFLEIRKEMDAELWLIGEGPEMPAVRSILQQAGAEKDVRYWGLHGDVAHILAQTHLLLMTSLSESFCLAALEAMACGVPVLAPRVGGLPEVVLPGVTGWLFPPGDRATAARLAVALLSDQAQYDAMSAAAVRHAARFGHEQVVPAYEDLYARLLARRFQRMPMPVGLAQRRANTWVRPYVGGAL
jgi:N-acetyl-alpha-D-glucosaminyl L-malate synthase BshA